MANPDTPSMGPIQARVHALVQPFYLQVMGLNARSVDPELLASLTEIGQTVSAEEVIRLLRTAWRETTMGAWYALFIPQPETVLPEVIKALDRSVGAMTAPPLAITAITLAGRQVLPSLMRHIDPDRGHLDRGAPGFMAAAIEHVGGDARSHPPTEQDRADFLVMSRFARSLTWT